MSDDLADEGNAPEQRLALLDEWDEKLAACYRGEYLHSVFLALKETISEFGIPIGPFRNLLIAFRQDQLVTRYETYDDLLGYCRNSANPVGRLYLYLFRLAGPERFVYSDAICTALQLTNFWQDVTVDLMKGRIYVPLEDLRRFECTEEDLQQSHASSAVRRLIEFEVNRTQQLFNQGKYLLSIVPPRARCEISLFIRGGEAILKEIRKQKYDTLQKRPVLGKGQKLRLMLQTFLRREGHSNAVSKTIVRPAVSQD
jgi:squalene synthase HpnC